MTNTSRLTEACSISMDFDTYKNKQCYSATKVDGRILLNKFAQDGFARSYGKKIKKLLRD